MKRKHRGLVALGSIILALLVSVFFLEKMLNSNPHVSNIPQFKHLPNTFVPGPASLKEIGRLERRMENLITPPADKRKNVDLFLFGHQSGSGIFTASDGVSVTPPFHMEYHLTFSFHSQGKRFCILNGLLYREGERLPDGGRIVRIKSDRILVKKQNHKKWIYTEYKVKG